MKTKNKVKKKFSVIGKLPDSYKKEKVARVLPYWLTHPVIISSDLSDVSESISDITFLEDSLKVKLGQNGIKNLFPVQKTVIPLLLQGVKFPYFRPVDICVSSPTGSGKTLAFVLPIVQSLRNTVVRRIRALIVLPVQNLATQIFKVFQSYIKGTNLKAALITGQLTTAAEQKLLFWKGISGVHSCVDIVVCTPGRLLEHIRNTPEFNLSHLRFFVMDEADRLMDDESLDWLSAVHSCIRDGARVPTPSTVTPGFYPPQKLLFSATLSSNPEKLQHLHLFHPKLVMATAKDTPEAAEELSTKYSTPSGLKEYMIRTESSIRPLVLHHLVTSRSWKSVLCFINSREGAHRLSNLLNKMGLKTQEFSAKFSPEEKKKILQNFSKGHLNVLISTDAMARGMDIDNVEVVVNYDPPVYPKIYIHRVGRTARAGKDGVAVTFVMQRKLKRVTQDLRNAGRGRLEEIKVDRDSLQLLEDKYKDSLQKLKSLVEKEQVQSKAKRKLTLIKKMPTMRRKRIKNKSKTK